MVYLNDSSEHSSSALAVYTLFHSIILELKQGLHEGIRFLKNNGNRSMKFPKILLTGSLLATVLFLAACSSDDDDNDGVINGADDVNGTDDVANDDDGGTAAASIDENNVLSGDTTLTPTDSSVSGTGSVVFTSSLGAVDSGKHFQVGALLDEGESVTIHAYSDEQLANGIDLTITRPENTPTSLEVILDNVNISGSFTTVAADQTINILMDVHNDENPAHVLIWPEGETKFGEDTTLINSEDTSPVTSQGAGAFWGLTLEDGAEITSASASEDRFED